MEQRDPVRQKHNHTVKVFLRHKKLDLRPMYSNLPPKNVFHTHGNANTRHVSSQKASMNAIFSEKRQI